MMWSFNIDDSKLENSNCIMTGDLDKKIDLLADCLYTDKEYEHSIDEDKDSIWITWSEKDGWEMSLGVEGGWAIEQDYLLFNCLEKFKKLLKDYGIK
jgi:hypothetical protein